ncbi:hypothetical protein DY037_01045 [Apilactobacillus micheneri]|uniref:Uncharacterized protein n=1 Tax=Apilactobacillus micheneri TaxID=1899430 RepID=A0A9Q8MTT1_9LACO|nr:hypothetical protein DY121_03935 [Apilactobacillus micheneri]TPR41805.1 hypothetical protein DY123_04555 [Apilactobacillus micheneri]TPR44196.1 hypothetical protein DY130_03930 [Apilactobacillus micheneri]TPR45820.1 hypothetical protein DY128_03930 [Apilactobacillus micheneri]TPR50564.1 hypothetical protein DY037_01045 [Apilactobacillus micheneri]
MKQFLEGFIYVILGIMLFKLLYYFIAQLNLNTIVSILLTLLATSIAITLALILIVNMKKFIFHKHNT